MDLTFNHLDSDAKREDNFCRQGRGLFRLADTSKLAEGESIMVTRPSIPIRYPFLGICGLSCRLCPHYQSNAASRCEGCKTVGRLGAACSMQTCALRKQRVEYCGFCSDAELCSTWSHHREASLRHDSFVSYRKLEENISDIHLRGPDEWERDQLVRERILRRMLIEYDDGQSRSYFCIAAAVLDPKDIERAMSAERMSRPVDADAKSRCRIIRGSLSQIATDRGEVLRLRK